MPKEADSQSPPTTQAAIYRDGAIYLTEPLDLPDETPVTVSIEQEETAVVGVRGARLALRPFQPWRMAVPAVFKRLDFLLFVLALFIYAATRFIGLSDFPIYFFSDEAIQSVLAAELIRDNFRDASSGMLLPPYFKNYQVWNLSLSVYMNVLTVALFGKSVFVTRATSVVISMLGVTAVGLTLKWVFKQRFWWLSILLLAGTPAWFLHSRTAFETVMMVSFYGCFLLFYLLYRCRPNAYYYLYPALICAAAAFYAYSNGQAIIGILGLLLLLIDFPFHWQHLRQLYERRQWRSILAVPALVFLLILPYIRFRLSQPTDLAYHLRSLNSYLFLDIPFSEKFYIFVTKYLRGLSLGYWFFPHEHDLIRHRLLGYYGHMRPELIPFLLIGLVICLRRWRVPHYRVLLLALLVTPIGAATVDIAITRVLSFVIPATLIISLGLAWLLNKLPVHGRVKAGYACYGLLAFASLWMLHDATSQGALWYRIYDLGGMQYGARQLFEIIPEYLAENPDTQVMLSPTWANGTDLFPRFFLEENELPRVQMRNVDAFLVEKLPLDEDMLFIMTMPEYHRARVSGKFKPFVIEKTVPYPDGTPGFFFVHLAYVDNIDEITAAEKAVRLIPQEKRIQIQGRVVDARYSLLDAGRIEDMFDQDTFTLGRVMEANPALVELTFPEPLFLSGLAGDFGSMDFRWRISLYESVDAEPIVYEETYQGLEADPHVEIRFTEGAISVQMIKIEIEDLVGGESAKIHIRELTLLE